MSVVTSRFNKIRKRMRQIESNLNIMDFIYVVDSNPKQKLMTRGAYKKYLVKMEGADLESHLAIPVDASDAAMMGYRAQDILYSDDIK